ncbi:16S rRNA (guanine(966)-N(2))-methyltransferase RsmD [Rhodocyclus gracilis]|uniref:16S rRNA (guanine(966)-N(2))-methyltransferase RsmD n=1 Tax=Rhodocyclus gracilis TaxID=2929842 RepID=UPI0030F396D8
MAQVRKGKAPARGVEGALRIVGGDWRRRVLRFPEGEGLRPTPDRVRETLFNWLGQRLDGLACLDLFAGSGALGFEAASRGAASVVMVERAAAPFAALRANAALLGGDARLEIVRADALEFARSSSRRFDVLFLDPPYRQGWLDRLQPELPRLLNDDAVIYVEAERPLTGLGDWQTERSGRAGQVCYHVMRRGESIGTD